VTFGPGELELTASYSIHVGPTFHAAGLRVQFHYNQAPGIHFRAQPPEEYRAAIILGLEEGMAARFPNFPATGSVWINEVIAHAVYSSSEAFYCAARLVIEQAHTLRELRATSRRH
jgi:hypothetical protein